VVNQSHFDNVQMHEVAIYAKTDYLVVFVVFGNITKQLFLLLIVVFYTQP